jgi:hypothetical protein
MGRNGHSFRDNQVRHRRGALTRVQLKPVALTPDAFELWLDIIDWGPNVEYGIHVASTAHHVQTACILTVVDAGSCAFCDLGRYVVANPFPNLRNAESRAAWLLGLRETNILHRVTITSVSVS